jgi:hypothetical protein
MSLCGRLRVIATALLVARRAKARFRVKVEGPVTDLVLGPVRTKPKDVKFNDLEGVLAEVRMTGWY